MKVDIRIRSFGVIGSSDESSSEENHRGKSSELHLEYDYDECFLECTLRLLEFDISLAMNQMLAKRNKKEGREK